jgi:hypothetical protein
MVSLTKLYSASGACEGFSFIGAIVYPYLGYVNPGRYLLYNGYEGMTSLVHRARCPRGIAVVDESRRLRTPGQRQVAPFFTSL